MQKLNTLKSFQQEDLHDKFVGVICYDTNENHFILCVDQ